MRRSNLSKISLVPCYGYLYANSNESSSCIVVVLDTPYPSKGICPNCGEFTWLAANGLLPFSHRYAHCGNIQSQVLNEQFAIRNIIIEPDKKEAQQFDITVQVKGDFWRAKEHIEEVVHNLLLTLMEPHK